MRTLGDGLPVRRIVAPTVKATVATTKVLTEVEQMSRNWLISACFRDFCQ